jgi:spermidine dehydrogenase
MSDRPTRTERRLLGLDAAITRRDFVNGALFAAAGAAVAPARGTAASSTDTFTGYGGVGDYARANGNTWPVVQAAHRVRDGIYDAEVMQKAESAGQFDLVVVGGGIAGLSAAYYFSKGAPGRRVLVLENHPMIGGEARQNEFSVAGERLLAPQGSNCFVVPALGNSSLHGVATDSVESAFFSEFALPREYTWQQWDPKLKPLRFARDNYSNLDGFQERRVDVGYYFDEKNGAGKPTWMRNIWSNGLEGTPFTQGARRDLIRWRENSGTPSEAESRYLDTITFKDYLERIQGYDPAVTRFVEPMIGLMSGVSSDATSARIGRQLVFPPDQSMGLVSFPGGNSAFPRAVLRGLLPDALPGADFKSLIYGRVNFDALDRLSSATRIKLNATVLRVEHEGGDPGAKAVQVHYEQGGKLYRAEGRTAVMASGGWINRHLLTDMPEDLRAAYQQFVYAPALIVNVALRQWRFIYDLGVTACRWFDDADGFGYCCNIRRNMTEDGQGPQLHPDRPVVLTFYMGLPMAGLPAAQQGATARGRLLGTPYMDFEVRLRRQMVRLFGAHGFNPERDIAGIILNRWGHARLVQPPGFFYGQDGRPGPLERVRAGYGRIGIGHAELNGEQYWSKALEYGRKAGEKAAVTL